MKKPRVRKVVLKKGVPVNLDRIGMSKEEVVADILMDGDEGGASVTSINGDAEITSAGRITSRQFHKLCLTDAIPDACTIVEDPNDEDGTCWTCDRPYEGKMVCWVCRTCAACCKPGCDPSVHHVTFEKYKEMLARGPLPMPWENP